jgi:MFS transporter, OPA family, glycerol-3-phosphate transporter
LREVRVALERQPREECGAKTTMTSAAKVRAVDSREADERRRLVITALYVAYAGFYLCRANVDASLPLLSAAYGYDKESLGRLASLAILCYAAGKVVLGPVGDVIGGRRLLTLSIAGSVVASLGFGASTSLLLFTVFAGLNRLLQAGGWVGVIHVASRELAPHERGSMMGIMSTSFEVGNVISLLLCGALVGAGLGWRALFLINPALFAAIGLGAIAVLARVERKADRGARDRIADNGAAEATSRPHVQRAIEIDRVSDRLLWLLGVRSFWIALALSFLLTFVRAGFATWIPMFLADLARRSGGTTSGALVQSAIFPAAGFIGALAAGPVSDRLGPGRRAPVIALSLALLVVAILFLAHGGIDDKKTALLAIGACGLLLLGPYSLLGGAIVLDVGAGRAAGTAAGLIDAGGYVGASLGGVLLGILAERRGWSSTFDALATAALLACMVATFWALGSGARVPSREVV